MTDTTTWWQRTQGNALYYYSRLLSKSCNINIEGQHHWEEILTAKRPVLWSFWHQQLVPFISFGDLYFDKPNYIMVTVGGARGGILNTYARRMGTNPHSVDMEGNPVKSGRTLVKIIKALRSGKHSFLAPDGPDGPAYQPKKGVSFLARKSRAAILPFGAWSTSAYQLKRWDRYIMPFPRTRIQIVIGKPIFTEPKMDDSKLLTRIQQALHQVRNRAQMLAAKP